MSDEKRTNAEGRFSKDDRMLEIENLYQSIRKKEEEEAAKEGKIAKTPAPKEEGQPRIAKRPAPTNEGATQQPRIAKRPAPVEPVKKVVPVNTAKPETASKENNQNEKPEKEKASASVIISRIILVLAVLVLIVAGGIFGKNYIDMRNNRLEAQKLASEVTQKQDNEEDAVGVDGILEKYRDLYKKNNDLVGWITVPNTKIDHPVVKAADNEFYMRKNFDKAYERRGSIFMDFRCDPKNFVKNTILYGHNFLDSTMFADLELYKDLDFYKSAPVIEFNTIYHNYKWKVFGVYLSNADEKDDNGYALYYIHPFMTDDNFASYVETVRERSIINIPVDVERTDTLLTLSTCTRDMDLKGHGQTNARCVVVARLIRDGEREDVNVSAATYNENPRYPQVWYTAHGKTNPYVNASRWYPEG